MKKIRIYQSINTKIVFVIVMLLIFALQLIGANFITQLERESVETYQNDRHTQIDFLESTIQPLLLTDQNGTDEEIDIETEVSSLLAEFSGNGITEIQLVGSDSFVLGTSDSTQQTLVGQLSNDTDIRQALVVGERVTRQYVDPGTNTRRWKIVAPVIADGEDQAILGAIMMESNIEAVYNQVSDITWIFLNSSLLAIVLSLILANMVSRALTTPIKEMQKQTEAIAGGDYSGQLTVYGEDELGHLALSINDLSNRVSEAQESIESERRRLDSVLTHMTDGVIATDRRGKVVIVNDMAQTMLEIQAEDALGQNILTLLRVEEEVTLRNILENQEDLMITVKSEESPTILRVSFSLIQRESGFISGMVCVLHDVTEQEKIERERKEFVSNVSHELRTPLTSMRSYLEALADGAWKDPEIAPHFLEVTQSETDRMIRMIQDLLHLSRIDSGRSHLELEIVNLTELIHHVFSRFEMLLNSSEYKEKNYQLKLELLDEPVWVEIDADRIIQVFDNILNNAIKYSPDGGTISGKMRIIQKRVIISISDQGMGIPKADLQKIFSRFYRVDGARSRAMGGSGLGLAISKEVIEQHSGRIWAESTEGKGTTFYVSLPFVPVEEEEWE
ncbi:cell wall metabolism sensor histidine kinase WalK [Lacticigenium naphthae]|uniref:cell wall metabolism sensor histidine kinase WalK n=1 Tax=Lacticigenium naphthae TaxID=515351 RepID=UPI00040500DB|nr:cell wall metabolism sensor histidine kinase WalK [Lacticigenium naphthae]